MAKWAGSNRRSRLPDDWETSIRPRILARDGWQCQAERADTGNLCLRRATDVDHKVPGDDHSDRNLQALCSHHHKQKSGREGGLASARARRRGTKGRRHPGIL